MTPIKQFEKDSDIIVEALNNDNFEIAKSLYQSRIKSLDDEEKKVLDLYINTKLYCSLDRFQKTIEVGFNKIFSEIRDMNQKLWGRDSVLNGNAK